MLRSYPKVMQLGSRYTTDIFKDSVEITEKLDGSQFKWGLVDGELMCRSKGAILDLEKPEKIFRPAVETCKELYKWGALDEDFTYCGETLARPKHNVLKYARIPIGNIALFAIHDGKEDRWLDHNDIANVALHMNIDFVRLLFKGHIQKAALDKWLLEFLELDSMLGESKIEGVVVKNLHREIMVGGQPQPFIQGKYVGEKFKEKHGNSYKTRGSSNSWGLFKERYKTEARWDKAIQHLREDGRLKNALVDIGTLITEVKRDISEECEEEIRDFLWKHFGKDLLRQSVHGLPEYYKEKLLKEVCDG